MTQSELPNIWGEDWKPRSHLDFTSEVQMDDLKTELIRFITERHDGHLSLVGWLFDEVRADEESESLDGPAFHLFSEALEKKLSDNLGNRAEEGDANGEREIDEKQGHKLYRRPDTDLHYWSFNLGADGAGATSAARKPEQ